MCPSIKPRPKRFDKKYGPLSGKLNFTNVGIDGLFPQAKDYSLRDTKINGLTLKVTPKGRKVFVLRYRNKSTGRERKSTLGRFPEMNVSQARKKALHEWVIINDGGDPSKDRQDGRTGLSFGNFCERYVRDHLEIHLKEKSQKEYKRLLNKIILPRLGQKPIAEITRSDIEAIHRSLQSTRPQANRVIAVIKTIFNNAESWEVLPQNSNPARGIRLYQEQSRERFLDDYEQEAIGRALAKLRKKHPNSKSAFDAITYLFLTGCRTKEALNLRWDDIDYQRKRVHLPDSKTGKRIVPIGDEVVILLQSIAEQQLSEFVFPGRYPDRPLEGVKKPWAWVCQEAGISNVRVHDIRHTFATDMTAVGTLSSTGAILGHKNPRTTARYAHEHDQTIRKDLQNVVQIIASKIIKSD